MRFKTLRVENIGEACQEFGMQQVSENVCPKCAKRQSWCVCAELTPIETRLETLILQHPQEPDRELGSAVLATLCLRKARLVVGLSWPNLGKALTRQADPRRWGVLFLGTKGKARALTQTDEQSEVVVLSHKGKPLSLQQADLEGIVVLDGNWRQAKAMWWRNPWLLKLKRIVLNPKNPSLYGRLRREPRRESLSTLESIALTLGELEDDPEIQAKMLATFRAFLERARRC